MRRFMCDFETATWKEDETWVWAWCVVEIGNVANIQYGNNIDNFFNYVKSLGNAICYFHNLKFDGEFLIYYLLTHEFNYIENAKNAYNRSFSTLISEQRTILSNINLF